MKKFFILFLSGFLSILFANIGKISVSKGEVFVIRDNTNITGNNNFILEKNDQIKTGEDGKVQLIFNDGTIITIGMKSHLDVNEYIFEENSQNNNAQFAVLEGTFRTITGKIGKTNPDKFKLKTKSASIGIRGTIFGGNENKIFCEDGQISVNSNGVEVVVNKNEIIEVSTNQAPSTPRAATQEEKQAIQENSGASDADMQEVEQEVIEQTTQETTTEETTQETENTTTQEETTEETEATDETATTEETQATQETQTTDTTQETETTQTAPQQGAQTMSPNEEINSEEVVVLNAPTPVVANTPAPINAVTNNINNLQSSLDDTTKKDNDNKKQEKVEEEVEKVEDETITPDPTDPNPTDPDPTTQQLVGKQLFAQGPIDDSEELIRDNDGLIYQEFIENNVYGSADTILTKEGSTFTPNYSLNIVDYAGDLLQSNEMTEAISFDSHTFDTPSIGGFTGTITYEKIVTRALGENNSFPIYLYTTIDNMGEFLIQHATEYAQSMTELTYKELLYSGIQSNFSTLPSMGYNSYSMNEIFINKEPISEDSSNHYFTSIDTSDDYDAYNKQKIQTNFVNKNILLKDTTSLLENGATFGLFGTIKDIDNKVALRAKGYDNWVDMIYYDENNQKNVYDNDYEKSILNGNLFGTDFQGMGVHLQGENFEGLIAGYKEVSPMVTYETLTGTKSLSGLFQAFTFVQDATEPSLVYDSSYNGAINLAIDRTLGDIVGTITNNDNFNLNINSTNSLEQSSYINEANFGTVINSGTVTSNSIVTDNGILLSLPYSLNSYAFYDFELNDATKDFIENRALANSSWGYFSAPFEEGTVHPFSSWIAGDVTPTLSIPTSDEVYEYKGYSIGSVYNQQSNLIEPILMDSRNRAFFEISFGNSEPILGYIGFATGTTTWDFYVSGGTIDSNGLVYTSTIESNNYDFSVDSGNINAQFYGEELEDFGGIFNINASNEYNSNEIYYINGAFKTLNKNSITQRTYSNTFTGNTLGYMFGEYSRLEENSFDASGNVFEEGYSDILDYFNLYNFEDPIAGGYKGVIGNTLYSEFEYTPSSYVEVDNMGEFLRISSINSEERGKLQYSGTKALYSSLPSSGFLRYNYLKNLNTYKESAQSYYFSVFNTNLNQARINLNNKNFVLKESLNSFDASFSTAIGKIVAENEKVALEGKIYTLGDILNTDEYMNFTSDIQGNLYGTDFQGIGLTAANSISQAEEINSIYTGFLKHNNTLGSNSTGIRTYKGLYTQIVYDGNNYTISTSAADRLLLTIDTDTGDISGNIGDITISATNNEFTSAYIHSDLYSVVFGTDVSSESSTIEVEGTDTNVNKGWMTTTYDKLITNSNDSYWVDYESDDYSSWGYWIAALEDDSVITPTSTWVAGVETPESTIQALMSNNTEYDFKGNVIGSVVSSSGISKINMDSSNILNLNIKFGSANPISGNMAFKAGEQNWNTTINAGGTIATTGFNTTNITGTAGTGAINSANLNGKFYGPDVNSVGGNFTLDATSGVAVGSFKAKKQ